MPYRFDSLLEMLMCSIKDKLHASDKDYHMVVFLSKQLLTDSNAEEFIDYMMYFSMYKGIEKQLDAFRGL